MKQPILGASLEHLAWKHFNASKNEFNFNAFKNDEFYALERTLVDTSRQLVFVKEGDNIATNERSVSDNFLVFLNYYRR